MKRAALILAALAAILTAAAAPVRTATENFVTNKIAEAVAAIPAPDYSTNNAALVETIQAKAPAPDLSPFLRNDKRDIDVQMFGGVLSGFGFHADMGRNDNGWNQYTAHNGTALAQSLPAYIQSNPWGFLTGYTETDPTVPQWAKAQAKPTYTASEVGATTPEDVTAAIREQSLGGIWDETLQIWWTPRMRNGSLTYEATTNVNLNAEN